VTASTGVGQTGGASRATWTEHLGEEVAFWRDWLKNKGAGGVGWEEDYKRRQDPANPLQEHIRRRLSAPEGATVKILDVGAGPLTVVGKVWPGRTVEITAVDPLAKEYERAMRECGVRPLVRTQRGDAERLTEYFAESTFDLVYAQNCIDHSYDPLLAMRHMVLVAKPGCVVLMEHGTDEAERNKYQGLHQWNFRVEDGRFIVWRPGLRADVERELGRLAEVSARATNPEWTEAVLKKKGAR
jgi:SAM-dependent methyltransferase